MRLFIFVFLGVFLISACSTGQNKSNVVKLKYSDTEYTLLNKGKGKESKPGDQVVFSVLLITDKGDTLANKRHEGNYARGLIAEMDSTTQPELEMLYSLKEGDSVKMAIPLAPELKARGLQNVDSLVYYIKLIKVIDKEELEAEKAEAMKKQEAVAGKVESLLKDYKAGKLSKDLKKTPNGVEYYIVEKGNGPKVEKGDKVGVAYYGVLKDSGKMFDNSFKRNQDLEFNAGMGMMIKGWDEAMLELSKGDKAIIFIPYTLGYGERGMGGVIPPKSDLVFYIEVNKVEK